MAAPSPDLIGKRVKAIRRRTGITLNELSEATGLNKGYLSRIESGEKSPSISTILKLSQGLKVRTSQLFGEEVGEGDIHLFRASGAKAKRSAALIALSGNATSRNLTTFLMKPSGKFEEETRSEHSGTEGLYVLEGAVEIQFSDRVVAVKAGDYVQFPGHLTHQVRRTSPQATVLIVVSEG